MGIQGGRVLRNTISNYISLVWRMVMAIFLVRILLLGLGNENYGFWTLLWVVFGYSLMLDFGFGQTVQKYTAEATIDHDMQRLNRVISTIVASYLLMGILIITATFILAPFLDKIFVFGQGAENIGYYKTVFLFFGIGAAMVFPTGIFPEILAGLGRYDIKNAVLLFNITIQTVGIYILMKSGYSLLALAIFCSSLNMVTNLFMAFYVFRVMPGLRLFLWRSGFKDFKEISSFSGYVYMLNLARMMLGRSDKIILGIMLGMGSVSVYQVGTRVSELMEKLTTQFQDTLGPLAASYYKDRNMEGLKWIMLKSGKITAFATCGALTVLLPLSAPILFVWLKVKGGDAVFIAQIMLLVVGAGVLFRSVPEKLLLMAGRHRIIAGIAAIESVTSIVLSVALVYFFGVKGIVFGPFIPGIIISLAVIIPIVNREFGLPLGFYWRKVFLPLPLMILPPVLLLSILLYYLPAERWNLLILGGAAAVGGGLYGILGFLFYLSGEERHNIIGRVKKQYGSLRPAQR